MLIVIGVGIFCTVCTVLWACYDINWRPKETDVPKLEHDVTVTEESKARWRDIVDVAIPVEVAGRVYRRMVAAAGRVHHYARYTPLNNQRIPLCESEAPMREATPEDLRGRHLRLCTGCARELVRIRAARARELAAMVTAVQMSEQEASA